jgi:hypothetical protein
MKINKRAVNLLIIFLTFLAIDCGEKPPLETWYTPLGKEYKILGIGVLYSNKYGKMLTVRFISENVGNVEIREREFQDIYMLIAQKMNLNGFTHVGLEAVPESEPQFGCHTTTGYRDNKSVDEVKKTLKKS